MQTIPITINFDPSKTIGYLDIDETYLHLFPKYSLSPECRIVNGKEVLESLSLVETQSYIKAIRKHKNLK